MDVRKSINVSKFASELAYVLITTTAGLQPDQAKGLNATHTQLLFK